ncbi:MAG: thiamine pyrophosphate-binding protein [Halobacteriaceae archaeon]
MTTTAERLVAVLEAIEIDRVYGFPGGRVIELLEHLQASDIEVVRGRDEREASVMAEAHGRLTGEPGVLLGQGPWIGSLGAFGQMEARLGSSPLVAITEASERGEYATLAPYQAARGDYGGLDLPSILDGITKEHWEPRRPAETVRTLQLAIKHATAGRPGPTAVVLDGEAVTDPVPEDPVPPIWESRDQVRSWASTPTAADVAAAGSALADADRPVIVAGNGVHASARAASAGFRDTTDPPDAYTALQTVAETYDAVVATSYLGKSTIPETHGLAAGVIGAFGHEGANQVVSEADTLLVVGCRLNPMDTNWGAPSFIRPDDQTIIHADLDPRNTGWVYPADIGLVGDAGHTLRTLGETAPDHAGGNDWARDRARTARADFTAPACTADSTPIKPQRAVAAVADVVDADTIVTADSGNNRFWLLHYLQAPAVGTYFGSGGVGGMGWAVPAGVSAALATDKDVIAVAGDGGFSLSMNSVETAVEHGVAPTVVVLNDTSLGMVRQMGDVAGAEFVDTDFVAIAEAFGADGIRVHTPDDLRPALETGVANDRPTVIDVRIDRDEAMADQLGSSFYESVGGLHE